MRTTGPVLAIGVVTLTNQVIFNGQAPDLRVVVGTALTAVAFGLLEEATPTFAVGLAWLALATTLLTPIGTKKAPVRSALDWWQGTASTTTTGTSPTVTV